MDFAFTGIGLRFYLKGVDMPECPNCGRPLTYEDGELCDDCEYEARFDQEMKYREERSKQC